MIIFFILPVTNFKNPFNISAEASYIYRAKNDFKTLSPPENLHNLRIRSGVSYLCPQIRMETTKIVI